jgi:hypothetical protein
MTDDDWLKALGEAAREAEQEPVPEVLRAPLPEPVLRSLEDQAITALRRPTPIRPHLPRWSWVAVPLAASVLALVWSSTRPPQRPTYSFEVSGGVADVRGPGSLEPVAMTAEGTLTIVLRPERPTEDPIAVGVFVVGASAEVIPWPVTLERAPGGAIRVRANAAALSSTPRGQTALVIVVGSSPDSVKRPTEGPGLQVHRQPLRWP